MTIDPRLEVLERLHQALHSPHGVAIQTNDTKRLMALVYKVRKEDPAFECLSVTLSPISPETELWIIKNAKT